MSQRKLNHLVIKALKDKKTDDIDIISNAGIFSFNLQLIIIESPPPAPLPRGWI